MTQPDFMVAKPTEARAKYSLIGTTLDPTLKDEDWIKTEYERDVKKPKATLHDCYHDPFLRMTAYRLEDTLQKYNQADRSIRDREKEALFFSNQQIERLPGSERRSRMLPVNYNRSEMNDKYNQYNRLPTGDVYEMNRVGLKPVQADRLPTGNYNYAKYRPREAKYPFAENGLIVEKPKERRDESTERSMSRFPNVREHIMRNFTVYDPKKDLSRRRYNTLSEALKETGLPNNIKHKHLLTRKGEDGGDASSSGGGGIVSEGDIKEMFEKYDEIQMELMEKHLARDKKKKELRQSDSMRRTISSPRQRMGVCLRDAIGASADWPMDQTEVRDNYKSEEYERSRNQLPPPDEARRRRDSYSKWVGLNVLDQKHRQEWKEYLAETSQKPAA